MIKIKAYKYRIYPTVAQRELLAKHFGCVRWVYNYALAKKVAAYATNKTTISSYDLIKEIVILKKNEETAWLSEVNSQSLQMALFNLDQAFTKFFRERAGFPNFKKKGGRDSAQFPQSTNVDFDNNKLFVMKFREGIKCRFHRTFEGRIKTTTISRTPTGKYYASILVEEQAPDIIQHPLDVAKALGIDVGIKSLITTSAGDKIENPKHLRQSIKKLKKAQRRLSKKVKGSNKRNKQRHKVAVIHEKIANQRKDFLHKITRQLVDESQVTTYCLETLNIAGMLKNHKLAKAIGDVGWHTFVEFLSYKAAWAGKNILRIGMFEPSSKACNACGLINSKLTLKEREWICDCGAVHDRDINAARNIRDFAFAKQNLLGQGLPEDTPGEIAFLVAVSEPGSPHPL